MMMQAVLLIRLRGLLAEPVGPMTMRPMLTRARPRLLVLLLPASLMMLHLQPGTPLRTPAPVTGPKGARLRGPSPALRSPPELQGL